MTTWTTMYCYVLLVLWLFMPLATSYYTVGCKITAVKSGSFVFTNPEIASMHCFEDFPPKKEVHSWKGTRLKVLKVLKSSISKPHLKVKKVHLLFELVISWITWYVSGVGVQYITLQPAPSHSPHRLISPFSFIWHVHLVSRGFVLPGW